MAYIFYIVHDLGALEVARKIQVMRIVKSYD